MAKKKKAAKPGGPPTYELGDLRAVELYVKDFLAGDQEDAVSDLLALGRDAAGIVARLAEQHANEQLRALAKKLVAIPPQVKTNLMSLRALSVMELVSEAHLSAPNATDLQTSTIPGSAVAIFDPHRISEAIVKGGRPRRDAERVRTGDVAWFAVDAAEKLQVAVLTAPPPDAQPVVRVRLLVQSGIVFIGRPEAADGPRLGELRLDPFRTNLHEHLTTGRLAKLKPGAYLVAAHRTEEPGVRVYLTSDPDPDTPLPPVDLGALVALPMRAAGPAA